MRALYHRLLPFAVLALLLWGAGGCASTPFVRGVAEYGPDVAEELRAYVETDPDLDTDTRAERLADADALDAAGRTSPVTHESVRLAWQRVRELYVRYVDADSDLSLPEKTLRAANVSRMDRLVEVEGGRWIYGG